MKSQKMFVLIAAIFCFVSCLACEPAFAIIVDRVQPNYHAFVGSAGTNEIFEFTSDGRFVRKFGAGYVNQPEHIVFDSQGILYASDGYSTTIRKFDRYGNFAGQFTVPGLTTGEGPDENPFTSGMTIDDSDLLYISDGWGYKVVVVTTAGSLVRNIWVGNECNGLALGPNWNLFVARKGDVHGHPFNMDILEYRPNGTFVRQFNRDRGYYNAEGLAFDKNGFLYVGENEGIAQIDPQGHSVRDISGGSLQGAEQVAVFADGTLYVSSYFTSTVNVFDSTGKFLFDFGGNGLNHAYALAFGPPIIFEWPNVIYDDFEDGIIDSELWVTHGYKGAIGLVGAGPWQYSISEHTSADGYLQARVWGPISGFTSGAEAWISTAKNFNDGKSWLIDFAWETTIGFRPHNDGFAILITDGKYTDTCNWGWLSQDAPLGSVYLWRSQTDMAVPGWIGDQPQPPFIKTSWSILIDPAGFASLYQSSNAQGTPYRQVSLDLSKEWLIKFVLCDGTNAGFDGGDNTFKLYHFVTRLSQEITPPIAEAGDDIVADANEKVTLDGSKSFASEPNDWIIRYTWKRLPDEVVIYSGPEPTCQTRALGRVEEVIELTVTDNYLATASDTLKIINRTTQDLKDQVATLQSQIEQLQQQHQETRDLVDRICSFPPIREWLRRAIKLGDLNQDGKVNMSDLALLTKDWLH